ncbi:hypothetical protein QAD02_014974 [Eretmocerus hayati]|uniref:Uncharacterized protein n=1 Tax=Eretmocerus hayati TaxID=131215 RepID=A0ACC2P6X0_9HYME|nr:hypothetical protein QAD02_014974 [Eretmocerus hayati]
MFESTCIFCERGKKLTKTVSGCAKVRWAANIRRDSILEKLKLLKSDELFSYHLSSDCYKQYTHASKVLQVQHKQKTPVCPVVEDSNSTNQNSKRACATEKVTRSKVSVPSVVENRKKCVFCGSPYHSKDRKLFRISEQKRAQRFFDLTRRRQDNVFVRTSHVLDVPGVFAADIYYHKYCMRDYEYQSETHEKVANDAANAQIDIAMDTNDVRSPALTSTEAIAFIVNGIVSMLDKGKVSTLSGIRDQVNQLLSSGKVVRNRDIKQYLINTFGESIEYSTPSNKNKSALFYSSEVSLDKVVERLHPKNILKESGILVRELMREVDFGLEDRFNDVADLQHSYENTSIPDGMVALFSGMFNIPENKLCDDEIVPHGTSQEALDRKKLKIKSLFQTMFFILKNGREKTPLQVMNGIALHATCKSKTLIDSLNHLGLSISYDEILRIRNGLALYTLELNARGIPLPNHLKRFIFTVLAFDNFDWNEWITSGMYSTHDTVSVGFQERSNDIQRKPRISETSVNQRSRSFDVNLSCQELKTFHKPPGKITLPPDFQIDVLITPEMFDQLNSDDFTWNLSRMSVDDGALVVSQRDGENSESERLQTVPSWSAYFSVVYDDNQKLQTTAFLPILPHPVTEYSTVYTAMCNFVDILHQLDQQHLPITCDEGVYRIARHIQLQMPEKFGRLIFILGSLHMAKVLQSCIGKYLSESGANHILVETESFGVNAVEHVLGGSDYARAMKGFDLLAEALTRLQIEAFFKDNDPSKYEDELSTIQALQDAFTEGNTSECKSLHEIFVNNAGGLLQDFQKFISIRREQSPAFKYWDNFLRLHRLLKNLTRADRSANWDLYAHCVKLCLPIFLIFDRTNYSRWLPLYYHDISTLQQYAPEVYKEFKSGKFVNKRNNTPFTSVGYDHGLESSHILALKGKAGAIGCTRNKNYMTSWNLIFHEIQAINNYYRTITNTKTENDELRVHHESSPTVSQRTEREVMNIIVYINSHNSNPFKEGTHPLINIATKELATTKATEQLLNIFNNACEYWEDFCHKRFIDKSMSISDPISRFGLPNLTSLAKGNSRPQSKSKNEKEIKAAHKILEIAKERNYDLRRLFSFKLTHEDLLFDRDGSMKKYKSKSDLIKVLEKNFKVENFQECPNLDGFSLMVDVMLQCRQLKLKEMRTFKDFSEAFCKRISHFSNRGVTRIDLIFDSYNEKSLKTGERLDRYQKGAIDIQIIDELVPCPKQGDLFWGSSGNKMKLQAFLRNYCLAKAEEIWPGVQVICSATMDLPSESLNDSDLKILQNNRIEEADSRLILHVFHACSLGVEKILVKSSDTDIVVLLLHYWSTFEEQGLKEIWMTIGAGAKKRYLALHDLAIKCGRKLCSVLVPLHHLTGADYTSKVGTKRGALEASPDAHLATFAQGMPHLF